jgi:hypothetical protein
MLAAEAAVVSCLQLARLVDLVVVVVEHTLALEIGVKAQLETSVGIHLLKVMQAQMVFQMVDTATTELVAVEVEQVALAMAETLDILQVLELQTQYLAHR